MVKCCGRGAIIVQTILKSALAWLHDWNHITQIIAIVGFLISIYNLAISVMTQRKNFDIRIYGIKSYKDVTFLNIGIENKSRLAIAITQMILICGEERIPCTAVPTLVCTNTLREGNNIISMKQTFSSPLPLTVSGMAAQSALVLFENMKELPADEATSLTVEVCTNRGQPVRMKLELPADWAFQRRVP